MTMTEIVALASLAVAILSLIAVIARNRQGDTREDAAEKAYTRAKLDSISNGVDECRVEYRTMRQRVDTMSTELASCKSSCASAHHRIDTIEGRLNHTTHAE